MDRRQSLNRFEFQDKAFLNQQIDFESVLYENAIVIHVDRHLAANGQAGLRKCGLHQRFVCTLKQPWTKALVDLVPAMNR